MAESEVLSSYFNLLAELSTVNMCYFYHFIKHYFKKKNYNYSNMYLDILFETKGRRCNLGKSRRLKKRGPTVGVDVRLERLWLEGSRLLKPVAQ